jgi:peptide deformylase
MSGLIEIRFLGDPVLRQAADEVDAIGEDLRELAAQMFEAMYDADGVGLAAPQVGVSKRLFVVDTQEPDQEACAIINPVIVGRTGSERGEEGCLSLPGLTGDVERSVEIVVEGQNLDGEPLLIEADGLLSRVIQHEIDHLDGILFIDRLSPIKRKLLLKKWKKLQREAARP